LAHSLCSIDPVAANFVEDALDERIESSSMVEIVCRV
jgi:hypothetical protein